MLLTQNIGAVKRHANIVNTYFYNTSMRTLILLKLETALSLYLVLSCVTPLQVKTIMHPKTHNVKY
jgi:hypothetical protein